MTELTKIIRSDVLASITTWEACKQGTFGKSQFSTQGVAPLQREAIRSVLQRLA